MPQLSPEEPGKQRIFSITLRAFNLRGTPEKQIRTLRFVNEQLIFE